MDIKREKDIEDAEIIEVSEVKPESILKEKVTKKVSKKKDEIEFSEEILERIKKAKRNIYVLKAWDKRTDTKIKKIYREDGEERTKEILNILYKNLTTNVKTTLVQYINGIIKNLSAVDKDNNKQNLTLFGNVVKERGLKSKKSINQARKAVKKPVLNNIKDLAEETNIPRDMIKEFESYDEYEKLKIEEKSFRIVF